MHHLTGRWIPPNERSKFVSAYLGSSVGVAIAYPIFGFIIKATSWEWVFHVCGLCGIVWYIFWLYYVSILNKRCLLDVQMNCFDLGPIQLCWNQLNQIFFKGLWFTGRSSKNWPSREGIYFASTRIVCYTKWRWEAEYSMEGNVNFESNLDQCNRTVWQHLGNFDAFDTSSNLFPVHSRLGNWDDRFVIWYPTFNSCWIFDFLFTRCRFLADKE